MKTKSVSLLTNLVLAFALSLGVQAETEQTIRNTCNSNVRNHNIAVNTNPEGLTSVTLSERGGYTFTLPALVARQKGSTVGAKVGLGKVPSGPALYITALTADKQANFKEVEAGTYRVFLIPATKEQVPAKEAPTAPDGKVIPSAPKTEGVPAAPSKGGTGRGPLGTLTPAKP